MSFRRRRRLRYLLYVLFMLALLGAALYNLVMNASVMVTSRTFASSQLPETFDGYRILHLSDLHSVRSQGKGVQLLVRTQEQKPDLIVITGDLVDSSYYKGALEEYEAGEAEEEPEQYTLALLAELAKLAPVYYVYGNHEAVLLDDPDNAFLQGVEEAGVTVLNNEAVTLERDGETIRLLGVQDPTILNKNPAFQSVSKDEQLAAALEAVTDGVGEEEFVLLLSHRPEELALYADYPVDLVLSGHAHGGQFRLPFVGGLYAPNQGIFPKYTSGFYTQGDCVMLVSRGIGNSRFPFRLFNPPEVISLTLRCQ